VHLSLAEKNGAVLHAQTTATMVEVGPGGRVTAIRFKRWDGSEGVASGKAFVLAAHAIEIPRLLLNSRSEITPNGVANSSDQVGRNLMDHPAQLSWALAPTPMWPYRAPLSTAEGAGHIIGTATSVATIIRISSSSARLSYRRRPIPP
jgi:choline dehydrogenase-like flavoprotein